MKFARYPTKEAILAGIQEKKDGIKACNAYILEYKDDEENLDYLEMCRSQRMHSLAELSDELESLTA